jgi:polyferredoxin
MKTKLRQKVRRSLLTASLLLLPVTLYYFSPALCLQGAAAGLASGSLLVFAALFVCSLFLGRAFCGWACPMAGLQELTARLRGRPVARRRIRWIKYLVWGPWFLLLVYLILQAGGLRRAELTYSTWHGISVTDPQGLATLLAVGLLFFLPALLVGRRASCHTLCWVAPFLIAGRAARNFLAWPALRLAGRPQACRSCGECTAACPMSIDVRENLQAGGLETTDCILCGSCADACAVGAVRLVFRKGRGFPPVRRLPAAARPT